MNSIDVLLQLVVQWKTAATDVAGKWLNSIRGVLSRLEIVD